MFGKYTSFLNDEEKFLLNQLEVFFNEITFLMCSITVLYMN